MLGKIEGEKRREWQKMRRLDSITDSRDMSLSKFRKRVKDREAWRCCSPWGRKGSDTTERLNNNKCLLNRYLKFIKISKNLIDEIM